jgi:2-polyprenyl-3-methyl-5-hydroxy-6-metoxy-1,4-benzoquinol methylase
VKEEKGSSLLYDQLYQKGGAGKEYFKSPKDCVYYPLWYEILERCKCIDNICILDIGCGPGQVAQMFLESGIKKYYGFDFSEVAVSMACERIKDLVEQPEKHIFVANALDNTIYDEIHYNTVLILEVLEHIQEDQSVLKKIKGGTRVFISVPNYDSPLHLRKFEDEMKIKERYCKIIDFHRIDRFCLIKRRDRILLIHEPPQYAKLKLKRIFLIEGFRK